MARAVLVGLAHLIRTPPLRAATAGTALAFVGVGMLVVVLPLHAERLTGRAAMGGFVWTAIESGAVITALAWGRWHSRWRPERVVLACLVGYGLVVLAWPLAESLTSLLALALLAGLAAGAGMPALFTTRQRYTPPAWYSQIATTGASLKLGGFAAGAALAGALAVWLDTAAMLWLAAAIVLGGAATGRVLLGMRAGQ